MNADEYLDKRVDDQIDWYSNKSTYNQTSYKRVRFVEITFAAIIPFVAGFNERIPYSEIIIGILGIAIAISAGMEAVNKYQENWLIYRTTAETLKHEKYLFLTKSHPYEDGNDLQILASRVEAIISKENTQWSKSTNKKGT